MNLLFIVVLVVVSGVVLNVSARSGHYHDSHSHEHDRFHHFHEHDVHEYHHRDGFDHSHEDHHRGRSRDRGSKNDNEDEEQSEESNEPSVTKKHEKVPQGRGILGNLIGKFFGVPAKSSKVKIEVSKNGSSVDGSQPADETVKGFVKQLEPFLKKRIGKMSKNSEEVKGPITAISFTSEKVSSDDKSDTIANGMHYFVKLGAKVKEGKKKEVQKYYHARIFKSEDKDPPVVVGMDETKNNGEVGLKDELKPFGIYTDLGNDPMDLPPLKTTFLLF